MDAIEAKLLTDENFKNTRNKTLQNVLNRITGACMLGDYYCNFKFHEDLSYEDYQHIKFQLESLGYTVVKIEEPAFGRNVSFSYYKDSIEIIIKWGSID
ncbi:hypothetical protein ABNX05_11290 [Lysinibacillus sp. M3]|uniref:Uncharacterized protein n=1 Tax=Lysinibacillus zambalensis TaxID=3160866 RepID=A0ABV1MRR4_9BACI